jgi:hypothetical protein
MTIDQALQLLHRKTPQAITAKEAAALRLLAEHRPACLPLLGGRRRVELFLKRAEPSTKSTDANDYSQSGKVQAPSPTTRRGREGFR